MVLGCIWDHFGTASNLVQTALNWCNWCKSFCHEVASKIFTTNTPGPPHLTLKSCFGVFRSVLVYLGSSRYCTKLGAILADLVQLMQKFMPRSRVRIFSKRSTPLDRKLMFWCVWWCLGAFGIVSILLETWCMLCWTGAIGAKVCGTKLRQNFSQRTHLAHPIGRETHVWMGFVVFGCI